MVHRQLLPMRGCHHLPTPGLEFTGDAVGGQGCA